MSVEACRSESVFLSALSIQFLQLTIELIQSFTGKWRSFVDHAIAQISTKIKVVSSPISSENAIFHAASDFHILRQRVRFQESHIRKGDEECAVDSIWTRSAHYQPTEDSRTRLRNT